ncbi:hypothetical protein [Streptomyces sp. NPDC050560]|uniref:hypothetical protein n=1 Tax=Streptomyces sp. NPDC050560 TaxID=3365630 RepID=UPI00379364AF
MKTTVTTATSAMFRTIANPRRTTLAHLADAAELTPQPSHQNTERLPLRTANPRRTVLVDDPAAAGIPEQPLA